ncbi:ATPase [Nostoc sp. CENA543]|uniref:hybrid sensor histidine kinase/response regulator n=1 Tax=Nostoc sp. CENA543 TaxID=1869241 RepID=UPI000CA230D2|nr:PAS domain S-box protein [Nostoc sp. CENA543]AUT00826.1 ATPase [Nostoc sp. CENA543]
MSRIQRTHLQCYYVSIVSMLLMLLLSFTLENWLKVEVTPLFLAAVVFMSWYGGLFLGLVATVLATVGKDYFFNLPLYSVPPLNWTDVCNLIIFSLVALFISSIHSELHTARPKPDVELEKLKVSHFHLLETINEGICIFNTEGQTEYVNPRLAQMLGYSTEHLSDRSIFDFINHQARLEIEQWLEQENHKHPQTKQRFEWRLQNQDQSGIWVSVSISPMLNQQGELSGAIAILTDITERKQIEAALRHSEAIAKARAEELETIMETVPVSVWIAHDPQCHYMSANRTAYEMMRMPPGSVMTATPASGEYPFPFKIQKNGQDIPLTELAMQRAGLTGQEVEAEFEFVFSDHDIRYIYGKATPLRDTDGHVRGVIGAFMDVTERQQAEAERQKLMSLLQQKQEWLDLAQKSAKIGSFYWEVPANVNVWSQELETIYGLKPGEFGGTYQDWAKFVHPDDLMNAEAELHRCINLGETEYFTDFRIIWQDGSIHWLQSRARILYDDAGQPCRMVGVNIDISERKQVEEALRQSEARLRQLLQSSIIGIIEVELDTITFANDAFLKMVGYSQEDVLARKLNWQAMTPPEYNEIDQAKVEEVLTSGVCIPFEKEYIRKDGSRVPIMLGAARLTSGPSTWVCFILDLTERKQAQAALQESELMFRTLANTTPQMFWITQPDGFHEYFNQRWYDYTGGTLEKAQGEGWLAILHPDDVQRTIECWYGCLQTGKDYEIEYRLRRADGEYRWHLGRAIPLKNKNGQILKWFGSCTDIHDQKLAIEERADAWEKERKARIELEQANRMKDDFLAIVSHELRSPLNPILGWAKLLKTRKLDQIKTKQALEVIERNAKLQARLIEDLLDVSRILRGKLSLNTCTVDLVNTIEAALETVRLAAEAKSIDIYTELATNECKVEGDPNRLQQVVWNLLTNAVKFTPEGGRVEVRLEKIGAWAQIQVSDTGKGITPDFLPYVFERFRQADEGTTRKFGGLGLGLAIVRHLVELHGGSVQVTSPGEGLGATFSVKLPLIATYQVDNDYRLPDCTPNIQGLRILIVDDDADTLELLTFILEQHGVAVQAVTSASAALEAIAQNKPDLLLSDIGMPEMDGYMLIQQIRASEAASITKLPAIALTAFAGESNSQKIISAGFQRHLTKPVEPSELAAVIANLIQI